MKLTTDRTFSNILTMALSWTFAATLLAVLFEITFQSQIVSAEIPRLFLHSFVYSNCIGIPLAFAVLELTPWISARSLPLGWLLLAVIITAITIAGSLAAGFTLMALGTFPAADYSWISVRRMAFGFLLTTVFGVAAFLYERVRVRLNSTRQELRAKELQGEHAERLAVEATLRSLESRIRPHFLFNTLNSISCLIQEEPALAERIVERLAALLRFSLDSSQRNAIHLGQELKITVDYLEIEKARFGNRLKYELEVPTTLHSISVPPFVIQTLVENSVKHAVSSRREGGELRIKGWAVNGSVILEVHDDGPGFDTSAITAGHGLDNLRARLTTLFEGQAELEIARHDGFTIARISFPNDQTNRRTHE